MELRKVNFENGINILFHSMIFFSKCEFSAISLGNEGHLLLSLYKIFLLVFSAKEKILKQHEQNMSALSNQLQRSKMRQQKR